MSAGTGLDDAFDRDLELRDYVDQQLEKGARPAGLESELRDRGLTEQGAKDLVAERIRVQQNCKKATASRGDLSKSGIWQILAGIAMILLGEFSTWPCIQGKRVEWLVCGGILSVAGVVRIAYSRLKQR